MSSSEGEPRLQIAPEKLDENVVALVTGANTCVKDKRKAPLAS
jgi:hypothetical protein